MTKKIMATLAVICFVCLLSVTVSAADEDVILNDASGIPDKNLYQVILQKVNAESRGSFTKKEAESVIDLWAPNGGISDLTGIGFLSNLKSLSIRDNWNQKKNEIRSLKPLQDLKNLEVLDIDHNSSTLENLEEIGTLTQLKELSVTRSGLTSLKGIENLTQMECLKVQCSYQVGLDSLEGIKNLVSLKELVVSNCTLKSLEEIENMRQLEKLAVTGCQLTSVNFPQNLGTLTFLNLRNNRIKNIRGLENLKNLTGLYLNNNQLKSIKEIENLKKLNGLDLSYNQLKKLPDLKKLRLKGVYQYLDLKGNYLSEKELKNKLKVHLKKKRFNSKWFMDQVVFQNNYKLKLARPSNVKGITKNTVKITGKIKRSGPYKKEIYVSVNDKNGRRQNRIAKVNKQGKLYRNQGGRKNTLAAVDRAGNFVIEGKNLKTMLKKGGQLYLEVYLYSEERRRMSEVQSIPLTVE